MKTPYLIQRIFAKKIDNSLLISEAFKLDYMGSSEFEWGALPAALRATAARNLSVHMVQVNSQKIYLVCEDSEVDEYLGWLHEFAKGHSGTLRLKEAPHFDWLFNPKDKYGKTPDLWWDIENHVAWTIDKNLAHQFITSLAVSVKFMDE